jgi:hypothetical protein
MKIFRANRKGRLAFTLTEMMVTGALGMVLISGVIMGHLVGVRMFQYTKSKLGGNDDARNAITKLIQEIRTAKIVKVGKGDDRSFTEAPLNTLQQGNAVQIFPTSATNQFIRYFLAADDTLRRMTNGSFAAPVMAHWITNDLLFAAESYDGKILTNNQNNRVISLTLQFYQIQYPVIKIGSGQLYDFYQVRTKITRRALE